MDLRAEKGESVDTMKLEYVSLKSQAQENWLELLQICDKNIALIKKVN